VGSLSTSLALVTTESNV